MEKTEMPLVILDEHDTDRLLRLLYHGTRPARVHTLVCACGRYADLRACESAWNGWQVLPFARCPVCVSGRMAALFPEMPHEATQARFRDLLAALGAGGAN
jgi:hypothetical protein